MPIGIVNQKRIIRRSDLITPPFYMDGSRWPPVTSSGQHTGYDEAQYFYPVPEKEYYNQQIT
eukprot:6036378-Amphidinium_carterae.2